MFDAGKMIMRPATMSELKKVWQAMKSEGKVEACFPGCAMTFRTFLALMGDPAINWPYMVEYDGKLAGFAWLNRWEHRTARCNLCSFAGSAYMKTRGIREAARRLAELRHDDGEYCFDTLLSYVHSRNVLSAKAAEFAGFKLAGIIPDFYGHGEDVKIYALTRGAMQS